MGFGLDDRGHYRAQQGIIITLVISPIVSHAEYVTYFVSNHKSRAEALFPIDCVRIMLANCTDRCIA